MAKYRVNVAITYDSGCVVEAISEYDAKVKWMQLWQEDPSSADPSPGHYKPRIASVELVSENNVGT